jgi:hypothetical protein
MSCNAQGIPEEDTFLCKLGDFGAATAYTPGELFSERIGSTCYIAPEEWCLFLGQNFVVILDAGGITCLRVAAKLVEVETLAMNSAAHC